MEKSDNGDLNTSNEESSDNNSNISLLSKVTKRVSEFFPTSLTKWFSPRQSVIRRRENDDDEAETRLQEPPKKRQKPSSDEIFPASSTYSSTPLINSYNSRHLLPGPSGYTTPLTTALPPRFEPTFVRDEPTILNGDDKSDSEDSTAYSSVQQNKESHVSSDFEKQLSQPSTSKVLSIPSAAENAKTPLRNTISPEGLYPERKYGRSREPGFNESVFGSPKFIDRTLTTKRIMNSPFYAGPVTYGGRNAHSKVRMWPLKPKPEPKTIVEIKPQKCSENNMVGLSRTAKRILDSLENFNTPVFEAKKIPRPNLPQKNSKQDKTVVKPNNIKELLIPSLSDATKMKMKMQLQDETEEIRKIATASVKNKQYSIPTIDETKNSQQTHKNKMRAKVTKQNLEKIDKNDIVDAVQLPEVQLPISTLPKFDFSVPLPTVEKPKTPETELRPQKVRKPSPKFHKSTNKFSFASTLKSSSAEMFNFAEPIVISNNPKVASSINNFKFSEPLNIRSSPKITFKSAESSTAPKRKEPMKINGQNTGFSLQPAEKLESGSVMDILGKPQNTLDVDLMNKFKPKPGSWECTECLVRNESSATRCVACNTLKQPIRQEKNLSPSSLYTFDTRGNDSPYSPSALFSPALSSVSSTPSTVCINSPSTLQTDSSLVTPSSTESRSSSDQWKCTKCMEYNDNLISQCQYCGRSYEAEKTPPLTYSEAGKNTPTDKWKCPLCLIFNSVSQKNCVACATSRYHPLTISKSLPSGIQFRNRNKSSIIAKKWECPICLVRNNISESTCVACLSDRPSADAWRCPSCMVENKASSSTCEICETPNVKKKQTEPMPNDKKETTSEFKDLVNKQKSQWICDSCMVHNPPERKTCLCCEAAKPGEKQTIKSGVSGFKFGIEPTSTTFKFGIDKTAEEQKNKFTFGIPPTSTSISSALSSLSTISTTTGFTFGIPAKTKELPVVSSTFSVTTSTVPGTQTETYKFSLPQEVTSSTNQFNTPASSTATFTFGAPITTQSAKPMFSFGAPTVTSTTNVSTTVSSTVTTTISNPPIQVTNVKSSTTEGTTSAVPQFSFGVAGTTKSAEEVKLATSQFAFGSVNTTTSAIEKPKTAASQFTFGGITTVKPPAEEAKPATSEFSFSEKKSSTETIKPVSAQFSFGGANTTKASLQETKPAVSQFSFGETNITKSSTEVTKPAASQFSFGGGNTMKAAMQETKPQFSFGGTSIIKSSAEATKPTTSQFSFGGTNITTSSTEATKPATSQFGFVGATTTKASAQVTQSATSQFGFVGATTTKAPAQEAQPATSQFSFAGAGPTKASAQETKPATSQFSFAGAGPTKAPAQETKPGASHFSFVGANTTKAPAEETKSAASQFSFVGSNVAKASIPETKPSVPQFSFGGSSGLPFNTIFPPKTISTTSSATSISFTDSAAKVALPATTSSTSLFGAPPAILQSSQAPVFGNPVTTTASVPSFGTITPTINNNSKSDTKSFSFANTDVAKAPFSLTKAPTFNFGSTASTTETPANLFNFNQNKPENPPLQTTAPLFGTNQTAPSQNGGFNFGTSTATLNFNFGNSNNNNTTSATPVFGFGTNQAGSGSAAPTPVPGVFSFGSGAVQPTATPTFSPDIRPNFNFTGGASTAFTAQGTPTAGVPQRKMRRAIRRTQLR